MDNDYYYGPGGWHGAYMYNDAWDDWYDNREDAREDWQDHREDLAVGTLGRLTGGRCRRRRRRLGRVGRVGLLLRRTTAAGKQQSRSHHGENAYTHGPNPSRTLLTPSQILG